MTSEVLPPVEKWPRHDWEHFGIWEKVKEAIYALPLYFRSETVISGLSATDLFTLNTVLGATIEENVVRTLNEMRSVWDPEGRYKLYGFTRQAQTFPDVMLKRYAGQTEHAEVVLGIELKGWYLLSKEEEPRFRFKVTSAACADQDLLVVVPWVLSSVISGTPRVFLPFVVPAKYAAEYRNYHWQHIRRARSSPEIIVPRNVAPYPAKSDQISDKPASDSGGNFGRIARTGIMDTYLQEIGKVDLRGIEVHYWRSFFNLFQEHGAEDAIRKGVDRLRTRVRDSSEHREGSKAESAIRIIEELENILA